MLFRTAPIVAAFPGPFVLDSFTVPKENVLFYTACAYVPTGFAIDALIASSDPRIQWLGYMLLVPVFVTAVMLIVFLRDGFGLKLDADGFEHLVGFDRRRRKWTEVSNFTVETDVVFGRTFVLVNYSYSGSWSGFDRLRSRATKSITGIANSYGLSHEELAEVMNGWRDRALSERAGVTGERTFGHFGCV